MNAIRQRVKAKKELLVVKNKKARCQEPVCDAARLKC